MTVDEVLNKRTINFPRNLDSEEVKNLIKYIAAELKGFVKYDYCTAERRAAYPGVEFAENKRIIKINGTISDSKGTFELFELKRSEKKDSEFSALQFDIVPGWELSEYRQEVMKLCDSVRKTIENYFEKKE